jgi:P-type Ca2+ transporter type 2C
MSTQDLYALDPAEVFKTLETSALGLNSPEAESRAALYGPNSLREPPPQPLWRALLGHTAHLMALLLWAAGVLAIVSGHFDLGLVIWLVVLINAAFSFWQEHRAQQAIASLKHLLPVYARVIRNGQELKLPASELVPGDLLVLAEGDNVPADARVVEEYGLRVNTATLTGEAMPARKSADASLRSGLTEVERPNLIFAGTSIVSGTGRAVVFATGMLTQFGRIANLTQAVQPGPSPLQASLARLTKLISLSALGLGIFVFISDTVQVGSSLLPAFILALGVIVAAVPEGLLPNVTLSLAMAVQRLAKQGVLVKTLAVVETLGTTSVICTDKSGTLTQNQMTIREVWAGGQRFNISGVGYEPTGSLTPAPLSANKTDLQTLLAAASLCNNSRLNPPAPEHPQWTCLGDQTEAALRVLALKGGADESQLNAAFPRIHELPFDARRKRMSTIHKVVGQPDQQVAFIKGAPREVLQLCTQILIGGTLRPLDNTLRAEILAANDDYARAALRVLALARRNLPPRTGAYTPETIEQGLTFLGLAAMMDPPRPEVAQAIKTCREAGIRIVMITGDYGLTAESVARRVGLLSGPAPRILTGAEVETLSDSELLSVLNEEVICARMAPEHKLRLVAAFQARGEVVAVSGDGVNDAPALRKADIGIAMGITGTDVAKEAADVILTNDNFAAIVTAIQEGRTVYANLRKFVTYIFASNIPEIAPFLLTALFNIPLALTVAPILAIDLGTDLLPALALGAEQPEPNIMRQAPRRRGQPLLDGKLFSRAFLWLGLLEAALCYAAYFGVYYLNSWITLLPADWQPLLQQWTASSSTSATLATTVFFAGVILAQVGNAFACRTEQDRGRSLGWFSNRFLLLSISIEVLLALILIYWPPLAQIFGLAPLPLIYWLGLGLFAPALYGFDRVRKSIARRLGEARQRQPASLKQESHLI